jgi:signal peptidase I
MKEFVKDVIVVVVVAVLISVLVKPIIVKGSSMYPTLEDSDYLLVSRQAYNIGEPDRGDIVVFPHVEGNGDEVLYIKRVIGVPGDHVEIENGEVYINGVMQDEDYINGNSTDGDVDCIVPDDEIYVLGDNRGNSSDSRFFGTVETEDVVGTAFVRLFPFDKIRLLG